MTATPAYPAETAASLETEVDRYLQPYLDTGNFSGSVLIARGGKILLSKAYASASLELGVRNTPKTVFRLASVSRIFTSAAILLLEQQGKLSVGDRLSKHLPEWPRGDEITIHHLLTLSAGFPNINTMPDYGTWQMFPQTPEDLVEKFRDLPLEYEPGEQSSHSNSNYNVLALLFPKPLRAWAPQTRHHAQRSPPVGCATRGSPLGPSPAREAGRCCTEPTPRWSR